MSKCRNRTTFRVGKTIEVKTFFRKRNKVKTTCGICISSRFDDEVIITGAAICSAFDKFDEKLGKEVALDSALDKHYDRRVKAAVNFIKKEMKLIAFIANTITHRFELTKVDIDSLNLYFLKMLKRAIEELICDIEEKSNVTNNDCTYRR